MPDIIVYGSGQMGTNYVRLLRSLGVPEKRIYTNDIDAAKEERLAAEFDVQRVDGPTKSDAAIIAVSTPEHAKMINAVALAHTPYILCEKPLVFQQDDLSEIEKVLRRTTAQLRMGLVINASPALRFLQDLMGDKGYVPLELHGLWGKPRPLDKNARPSAGDAEDESVHPIAFCMELLTTQSSIDAIRVSAEVGFLPFVDPAVQEAARVHDISFPNIPNHMTSARFKFITSNGPVSAYIQSSFLMARQTRCVSGVLGTRLDPRYSFLVEFDVRGERGSEDIVTLVDLRNKKVVPVDPFPTNNLADLTQSFLDLARTGRSESPALASFEHAKRLVSISHAIGISSMNEGAYTAVKL
jgi:predicted dehydrogenase